MAPINPEVEAKILAATLNRLTSLVFGYDLRKGLSKAWFRELDRHQDLWERFAKNWEDSVRGSLALLSVFGPGSAAAAFVRSVGENLPADELALVRLWRSHPWQLVAFQVTKNLGSGFVQVKPLGSRPATWPEGSPWNEFRLFSPNISSRPEAHVSPFLTLLWPQGLGYQTYGPILNFPGWTEEDFNYLVALNLSAPSKEPLEIKGLWPQARSLTAELTRHPVFSYLLTASSDHPVLMGPLGPSRFQISVASFEDDSILEEAWWKARARSYSDQVGTFTSLEGVTEVYLGDGSSMRNPWFVVSHEARRIYLEAMSSASYQRGRKFLEGVAEFPQKPIVDVSTTARIAAQALSPHIQDAYDRLIRKIDESQKASPSDEIEIQNEKQKIEKVMERVVNNYNEGLSESAEQTASALGVDPSIVLELTKLLNKAVPASSPRKLVLDLPPRVFNELSSPGLPRSEGYVVSSFDQISQEMLESVPLMRLFRRFIDLAALAGGRIPATASGYLDTQLVRELWGEFQPVDPSSQWVTYPRREADWFWLLRSRRQFEGAGLLALDKRGFFLTDRARALLDQPLTLYKELLTYGLHGAVWGMPERSEPFQTGFRRFHGLLIYALGVLSAQAKNKEKWVNTKLLAEVWIEHNAFSEQLEILQGKYLIEIEFNALVVKGLFHSLGLAEIHPKDLHSWGGELRVRPSQLYHALFSIQLPH
ncbi:MAG: hypothetical protein HKM06_05860 [Spirochaetales bacterium]|nr:hypothetical protein [Spirochaetales bacterium]